uniref:Acyl carrier protein n=1 Tax=Oryza nivara TaxID=4536 RepID=A0A0E0HDP4_ORYNI
MAMAAARRALLSHLRVPVLARPAAAVGSVPAARLLSSATEEGSKGSFLDKGEVADRIVSVVKNFQKVEPSKVSTVADAHRTADSDLGVLGLCSVTPNAHFQKDLGLDSLDTVEIVMAFEEEFGFEIPDNEAEKIDSIKTAVDFVASHPQAK